MAEFRRLISYIYEYEAKEKGKNVGFVKLESRNGLCKLNVNVKKLYMGRNDMGVYLLTESGEIFLGNIFLRNGCGEFRAVVQIADVEKTGKKMDECYGLSIHDKEDSFRVYTTIWEDSVPQAAQIVLEPVTSEAVMEKEVESGKVKGILPEIKPAEAKRREPMPNFEMGQLEIETMEPEEPLPVETTIPVKEETDSVLKPKTDPVKEEKFTIGDQDALLKLDAQEKREKQTPIWEFLSRYYPKIKDFESENKCEIVVIKPQDIGLLPRETWIFGNNSFLLHGYYNYRYLIVARLENQKGEVRYILGVPGHYYSNEKYMASMFGFPHFVLSQRQPSGDGRFGYWYTDIQMDDGHTVNQSIVPESDTLLQKA